MSKILHVIRSADPRGGGPIEGVRQRARVLREMGHVVEVASLDGPEVKFEDELTVHCLGPGRGGYGYEPKLVSWLLANASNYDYVVVNGIWQYHSLAVSKAMRRLGRPYVVFPHGMLDPWFKRAYPLKHLKKMLYWPWAEYRVLKDAAAVLFTSEEEKVLARHSFKPYRVEERVVRYGTAGPTGNADAQAAEFRNSFQQLGERPFLLFLSRIHPKKGCDLLIKAFGKIASNMPELMLVMAGPDQVGWKSELEALASSLGVSDRIVWTGMLSGDLKWGAYHACEAFVLPSHQENFGIVVAEALACSKPVLITDKVNIWREVQASGAGFVSRDTDEGVCGLLYSWLNASEGSSFDISSRASECFQANFEIRDSALSLLATLGEVAN